MRGTGELRELLAEQRESQRRLEEAVAALESADYMKENDALRGEAETLRREAVLLSERAGTAERENRELRERLFAQMYSQKHTLLQSAKEQASALFGREEGAAQNRLSALEASLHERVQALRVRLQESGGGEVEEIFAKLDQLSVEIAAFGQEHRRRTGEEYARLREEADRQFEQLREAPLTPEQMAQKTRQNSMELRIGSKITIIVGMFFILLAVVFGLRYTFTVLQSDVLKGLTAYCMGGLFLGAAELMSRRQRTAFTTGLCAGGVAILFASTAVSYFSLGILTIPWALVICMAVSALSLLQSYRYNAQLVAVFALIGGYMPMTALTKSPVMILSAMGYFLILSLFVLLLALKKRWQTLKFFSLVAQSLSIPVLLSLLDYRSFLACAFYIFANFLLYLVIVLVYPLRRGAALRHSDVVLLALNTLGSCGFFFLIMRPNGYEALNGAVAALFCIIYFLLAKWLGRVLEKDSGARGLFYAVSFAFLVLSVPLQLEPRLTSLGWLAQAVALCCFGVLTEQKWYRRAGLALTGLCSFAFLLLDLGPHLIVSGGSLFVWKYGAITLGFLLLMGVYLYRVPRDDAFWKTGEGGIIRVLRFAALINSWWFGLYLIYFLTRGLSFFWRDFTPFLLQTVLTLGIAIGCRWLPILRSKSVSVLSWILYWTGFLMVLLLGLREIPQGHTLLFIVGLVALIGVDAGACCIVYDLLRARVVAAKMSYEWVGFWTWISSLVLVLQLMMVQGQLSFRSMLVSFVLVAFSFAMIITGFVRRYSYLRRFGLILSLLSITKLFLVDLYFLHSGQRVLSYFVFGLIFIAISYVYNIFSRRFLVVEQEVQDLPEE